ncbi:precorrin-6y C5,15-methyltransferase (decarboxylating) subunit CbiE [Magnetovibrio sp. PR-2]|uniref:precorrin-6y C5,15-methyltransferase (decarboxylating) subunit CbiE n=1 Tax=Magnetovibrio sp. PR-2 TaxID=3120356 RepID=UPI002FCE39D1
MIQALMTVVGIGEDGLLGLNPAARALVDGAEVLVGGERHLAKAPEVQAERLGWSAGFDATLDKIEGHFGKRIIVLASGDPSHCGVGTTLIRRFGAEKVAVLPHPSSISLTCARMGWSVPDVQVVTIHGRPLESLNLHLHNGARLVVLARDGKSPREVAKLLNDQGFGGSTISVWEHLGGEAEHKVKALSLNWGDKCCADLCTLALDLVAGADAKPLSRLAGLPDAAFEHDGQLTKREVRAVTLSALAPKPGEMLWDLGAGAGSISIEWMRADRSCQAVAVERDGDRAARIARNAAALGVPRLTVEQKDSLESLSELSGEPDAIFIGGGVGTPGLLDAAWVRVKPGGRLVANAVTLEGEEALSQLRTKVGGDLLRLTVERAEQTKGATFMTALRTVTQFVGAKP